MPLFLLLSRVARWFVFKPKMKIWVHFRGSCNGRCWTFCIVRGNLVYFFPVLVFWTKKNLATLLLSRKRFWASVLLFLVDTVKQGCPMVCFLTNNPNLGKFWSTLEWKKLVGIFCGYLDYIMAIWNILWSFVNLVAIWYICPCFGIFNKEKSGNPTVKSNLNSFPEVKFSSTLHFKAVWNQPTLSIFEYSTSSVQ
jgi:hypothetical protein